MNSNQYNSRQIIIMGLITFSELAEIISLNDIKLLVFWMETQRAEFLDIS